MIEHARIPFPDALPMGPERCGLVGEHPDMLKVYRLISVAAPTLASVLILGAPGTGRTTVARCIHENSILSEGPWLAVRLSELTPEAAEIELFGEEQEGGDGGFRPGMGRLEQARGGTLFLEDASSLSLATQARLVTALHAPAIERRQHGGARSTEFRIIASAPRDLRLGLAAGTFREDLYFLLAVVTIPLPALADRGDDLLALLAHFVRLNAETQPTTGPELTGITPSALRSLEAHQWSSNVSELRDLVYGMCERATGDTVQLEDLPPEFRHEVVPVVRNRALATLAEIEAEHIALVLRQSRGMIHRAAEILGVHRNTLTRKIREYGIPDSRGN